MFERKVHNSSRNFDFLTQFEENFQSAKKMKRIITGPSRNRSATEPEAARLPGVCYCCLLLPEPNP